MGFTVFGFDIKYYGVIIAFGMLLAVILAMFFCKKRKYDSDIPFQIFLIVVPAAVIGARLYYITFYDGITIAEFFDFRGGGMAIYGGIIFGAAAMFLYSRIKKCGFLSIADLAAPGLILAQSLGRWGNFFNGEAYGFEVPWNFFPFTVEIDGGFYLATFFYESALNFIGFLFLLRVFFYQKQHGTTTALYLIWYGVVRAVIEPLRTDSLLIFPGDDFVLNRISFLVSVAIIILGMLILYFNKKGKLSQNDKRLLKQSS
jgi:phosphatidylglycerol:prolipoprotein diacylglycerol transferase